MLAGQLAAKPPQLGGTRQGPGGHCRSAAGSTPSALGTQGAAGFMGFMGFSVLKDIENHGIGNPGLRKNVPCSKTGAGGRLVSKSCAPF